MGLLNDLFESIGSIAGAGLGAVFGGPLGAFLGGTLGGTVIDRKPLKQAALTSLLGGVAGQGLRLGIGYLGNGITWTGARLGSNMLAQAGVSVASLAASPVLGSVVGVGLTNHAMNRIEAMLKPKLPNLQDQLYNNFEQMYNRLNADPVFNRSVRMPTIEELTVSVADQTREAVLKDPVLSISNPRVTFEKISEGKPRFEIKQTLEPHFENIADQKPRVSNKIDINTSVVDIGSAALTNTTNKLREAVRNGFVLGSHEIQPWERKNFSENIKKKQKANRLRRFIKESYGYVGV